MPQKFKFGPKVIHYPRLDTVLMVERFVRDHSGEYQKTELWRKLPKRPMYQTFNLILDYLQQSGKVVLDKDGKIVWIWNPKLIERYKKGLEIK